MEKIAVESVENRGNTDCPFGFVYFTDGRRVAHAFGEIHDDVTGGWGGITPDHVAAAQTALAGLGLNK